MSAPAIRAVGLSKQYRLGEWGFRYQTLREQLSQGMRGAFTRRRGAAATIWALDDVTFEIGTGEVVGIVGRNGSGKTTLLKVLSRITRPTRGRAELRGRLGSLLEVGTGFHPELTGRENIFLNGAILGMRRTEIDRKFDSIVDFAGVSAFLDTPVKRYSSGMYVRLAFSVAAHLEPEILLVDEVLAVGDAEFQRRCIGKMEEIGQSGRTVVFVSHSMPAVARLCERALWLEGGRLISDGPSQSVIGEYLHSGRGPSADCEWSEDDAPGNAVARLRRIRVVNEAGATADAFDPGERVGIEYTYDVLSDEMPVLPWMEVYNEHGLPAFGALDTSPRWNEPRPLGRYVSVAWIPAHFLNEGTMLVSPSLRTIQSGRTQRHADVREALAFRVIDPIEGETASGGWGGGMFGVVRPLLDWTTRVDDEGAGAEYELGRTREGA